MPVVEVSVSCPVPSSFRVDQIAGLFDLTLAEKSKRSWSVQLPGMDEEWQIGAIVGPSGSGKTVISRRHFGKHFVEGFNWPKKGAVVDAFDEEITARDITGMLTSVGFSSPPDWIKPYAVLSNGQRFRCDLARALLTKTPVLAFDEFTSVVDRQVAKFGSAAVAKTIRKGRTEKFARRFVAVTCHYDVLDWLQPDWVLDLSSGASGRLARRWLQQERRHFAKLVKPRPPIVVKIYRCRHSVWSLFKDHHYLSGDLHRGAHCYVAAWAKRPVAFSAVLPLVAKRGRRRLSRTVVLPDFQGMGIGVGLTEALGSIYKARGLRLNATASHPAMIQHRNNSPLWNLVAVNRAGIKRSGMLLERDGTCSFGRSVASFEYVGD